MRLPVVSRFVRQLTGLGALDNVIEVLAERAAVTERVDAFSARVAATVPVSIPMPLPVSGAEAA